jgi:hypothetical protein
MATQSGLGTSTPKEAKEYFAQMERNQIEFEWLDKSDVVVVTPASLQIELAFSKKMADARKDWLIAHRPGMHRNSYMLPAPPVDSNGCHTSTGLPFARHVSGEQRGAPPICGLHRQGAGPLLPGYGPHGSFLQYSAAGVVAQGITSCDALSRDLLVLQEKH